MHIKDKLKTNSLKLFDYTKIKSKEIKEKIDLKIREKAILAVKAKLALNHKTFEDYNDEELEIIIADEERKIIDDLKTKSLIVALAALGLNLTI